MNPTVSLKLPPKWLTLVEQVTFAFQPIVNIHTGQCYGYEALLRNYKTEQIDSIAGFFNTAYDEKVLQEVDRLLLAKALQQLLTCRWYNKVKLFYNTDARLWLENNRFIDQTIALLEQLGLPRDMVCLEITSRNDQAVYQQVSSQASVKGRSTVKLAVDDCGENFLGFNLMCSTEPEYIKINRFFIQDINKDIKKRSLLASIINIAHVMGSQVIAEEIETEKEFYSCKMIGCDLIQGYLIQPPKEDVTALSEHYAIIQILVDNDRRKKNNNDNELLKSQMQVIPSIPMGTKIFDIFEQFKDKKDYPFFIVVNQNMEPLGIIHESSFKKYAYSRFGNQLLQNPSFNRNMEPFISKYPMLDIHDPVERYLELFSQNDGLEGIIITENMRYFGFLNAQALLKIVHEKNMAFARDQNPLTKMPGNHLINEHIAKAMDDMDGRYYFIYFDFDYFKPYNDKYGFRSGDRVILYFSEMLRKAAGQDDCFAGHVGGDDFFMSVKRETLEDVTAIVTALIKKFSDNINGFYDDQAKKDGFIISRDRDGQERQFPLLSVSAVILEIPGGRQESIPLSRVSQSLADHKKQAKCSADKICTATIHSELVYQCFSC